MTGDRFGNPHPAMPASAPAISVVMPVRNGAAFLERAAASLRGQTFSDWEVVAVDDGSDDGTAGALAAWARADRRVRAFRHRATAGVSAARNTALRAARGAWVAYLDCDDEYYRGYLERVWDARTLADVLVSDYDIRNPAAGGDTAGREYRFEPPPWGPDPADGPMPVPLGVAHRRDVLDRIGLFDEAIRCHEDRDLWARMAAAGVRIEFLRLPSGRYHVRPDSLSRTFTRGARAVGPPVPADVEALHNSVVTLVEERRPDRPAASRATGPARVLFCSYHGYLDPASGAARAARDLLEAFVARGRPCGVLCGPDLDAGAGPVAMVLRRHRVDARTETAVLAGTDVRLHHALVMGVPLTVFEPARRVPAPEPTPAEEAAFLEVLRRVQGHFRADVMLTYGGHRLARSAMDEARRLGMRVAFWLHNLAYTDGRFFRAADAVLVPSAFARAHYARLGVEATAIPGPVLADRVRLARHDGRYLTFVNPIPSKGVTVAARLFGELARARPEIPVLVVAARGDVDWLARTGVDLSAVRAHRMPNTPDPRDFLAVTRVLVVPSVVAETFGRVAAEALVNGIPVVASDHEALGDTVGPAGTLVPIPDRVKADPFAVPTAEEVRPWVDAVVRAWDQVADNTGAVADVCSRWSGPAAIARFAAWFDALAQGTTRRSPETPT